MCFVWIWEQTAIISLYNINWVVCITETESFYCDMQYRLLNLVKWISSFRVINVDGKYFWVNLNKFKKSVQMFTDFLHFGPSSTSKYFIAYNNNNNKDCNLEFRIGVKMYSVTILLPCIFIRNEVICLKFEDSGLVGIFTHTSNGAVFCSKRRPSVCIATHRNVPEDLHTHTHTHSDIALRT